MWGERRYGGMKIAEIINYLDYEFHPEYQEDYDNAGFLLGDPMAEATGALVAIDLTEAVAEEAIANGLNLIVTHHPMIFGGVKRITTQNALGRMITRLIKHDICVYAAHTNLDNIKNGVNGILAEKLGLKDCQILKPMEGLHDKNVGAGMIGRLERAMDTEAFLQHVKEVLKVERLRCSPICRETVERVAICGGAGSFLIGDAMKMRADVLLTADMKYHDFQRAEGRIVLCDAGHYETEQFAKEIIYSAISKKFRNFACRISDEGNAYIRLI